MRYAYVENGVVTNVIEADEGYVAPFGEVIATDEAGIGWKYDDGIWIAPEDEEIPVSYPILTARQFWLAALELGITEQGLLSAIEDETNALYIADEIERAAAAIDIAKAQNFRRDYPLVDEMAEAFGLSSIEMDALWAWAALIE